MVSFRFFTHFFDIVSSFPLHLCKPLLFLGCFSTLKCLPLSRSFFSPESVPEMSLILRHFNRRRLSSAPVFTSSFPYPLRLYIRLLSQLQLAVSLRDPFSKGILFFSLQNSIMGLGPPTPFPLSPGRILPYLFISPYLPRFPPHFFRA